MTGTFADCCVAFAREHEGKWLLVLVPRLSSRVGFPPVGNYWKDTVVELPASLRQQTAKEIFTGRDFGMEVQTITISEAMESLPFAAYTSVV